MRGSKPASHVRGEKRAQCLRCQFGNCNHGVIALSLQPGFDSPCASPKRWDMPPHSAAALTLMQFCRCCLTRKGAQLKRSCRFGNWKRESPRMVRPATCRGRHSFGGFCAHAEVGRDHDIAADREKGPPLGAFYLAPY